MHCESVSTYETKGKVSWKIVNMLTSWKLNEKQTTAFLQWAENMRFLEQEMSKPGWSVRLTRRMRGLPIASSFESDSSMQRSSRSLFKADRRNCRKNRDC